MIEHITIVYALRSRESYTYQGSACRIPRDQTLERSISRPENIARGIYCARRILRPEDTAPRECPARGTSLSQHLLCPFPHLHSSTTSLYQAYRVHCLCFSWPQDKERPKRVVGPADFGTRNETRPCRFARIAQYWRSAATPMARSLNGSAARQGSGKWFID